MGILGFIVTLFWGILAGIAVTILIVYLINELWIPQSGWLD